MSMLPSQHLFDVQVDVLRRFKTGQEDGTPIYATRSTADFVKDSVEPEHMFGWPSGFNSHAYVDYEEDLMTVVSPNGVGSITTVKALLLMEPGANEFIHENDQLVFDGQTWRIDTCNAPRGLWGARHTQIKASRQVNV
jgi:hypothetical protein